MKMNISTICEQLENRRLLAATLVDGVLKIVGTQGNDEIKVALVNGKPNRIGVNVNGGMSHFAAADVRRVIIHGRAGNDTLFVGVDNPFLSQPGYRGLFPLGVFMTGGPGDDLIAGSINSDHIFGGGGNDLIYGIAGDDLVDGGEGHDEIYGGDGNDIIIGGAGDDEIYADAGDDQIFGGDGADRLYGDDGNDQFAGGEGADRFWGGKGNDRVLIPLSGPSSAGFAIDQPKELNDLWLL